MYAQDDWKVNPKLTVNAGLRYEIPAPVEESHCRSSQVNFTLANPGADGLPGAMEYQGSGPGRDGRCSPMNKYWGSWGPRLGASYQLYPNTVFRAAYGIYYTPLKVSNFANTDSAGFFAVGYSWAANPNTQTPSVIPSQVADYPGALPPNITPTALNGLNGGGGAATGGPVMLPALLPGQNKEARPGAVQNWTFDVQQQLPGQWILDIAYLGNHGAHLQALLKDPNVDPLSALSYGSCLSVLVTQQASNPACAGKATVPIPYSNFLNDLAPQLRLPRLCARTRNIKRRTWILLSVPIRGVTTLITPCKYNSTSGSAPGCRYCLTTCGRKISPMPMPITQFRPPGMVVPARAR
jgi:hypothetical protein